MPSTLSKLSKAVYKLDQAYTKGSCIYPRVANDYIKDIKFFEHPHPPVASFDEYSTPLRHSEYPLIKELSALELTNENISTPATLFTNLKTVDNYFDGKLQPRITKLKEIEEKLDCFHDHIEDLVSKYGESVLDKDGNPDVNKLSKDGSVSQFKMDITPFQIKLAPCPEREKQSKEEKKDKVRDDVDNFPSVMDEKKIKVNSIDEAFALYLKKKLLMQRLREQKEQQYRTMLNTNVR